MNERIKLLAQQAKDWAYADHDGYTAQMLFEHKFAELLIQECAMVVYNINLEAQPNDDGCYDQASFASDNDVLNHFGVSCFNGTN